jgi:hypothetical protein
MALHAGAIGDTSFGLRIEHMFVTIRTMEPHEIEFIRRSIAMLPSGHSAGALTKDAAMALVHEVLASRSETERYRRAVAELRRILEQLEGR